jgi:5-hydroxyisourate hydrolase-like protein (transthyretin family)
VHKRIVAAGLAVSLSVLSGCDVLLSGDDATSVKALKKEKSDLTLQVERLTRENGQLRDENTVQKVMIGLYALRFATERYAASHHGSYPEANSLAELQAIISKNLPANFTMDTAFLETIRSSDKGYIFIANVRGQKIVVSNLI